MQGLTFRARASTKFTPPLCRTPLRQKAGRLRSLSRMPNEDSGFDVISLCFRHVIRRFLCIRLLGRHLMPRTAPSPRRSPPRLLNAAARGGLEPAPTSRLQRAYLHLPHSEKNQFQNYITSPTFRRGTPLVHESGWTFARRCRSWATSCSLSHDPSHEIESPPQVQDEVPSQQLVRIRPSARATR